MYNSCRFLTSSKQGSHLKFSFLTGVKLYFKYRNKLKSFIYAGKDEVPSQGCKNPLATRRCIHKHEDSLSTRARVNEHNRMIPKQLQNVDLESLNSVNNHYFDITVLRHFPPSHWEENEGQFRTASVFIINMLLDYWQCWYKQVTFYTQRL